MVSSARRTIICILVVIGGLICVEAQTTAQKVKSASISGKVTLKGRPLVGLTISARNVNDSGAAGDTAYGARTDQTGSYRIANLPAGTYEVSANAPALVPITNTHSVVVGEAEEVESVNIQFVPGSVITGKVTDSEGAPLIEQYVRLMPVTENLQRVWSNRTLMTRSHVHTTDDRGIYRVFGLPAGRYKISVGDSGAGRRNSREYYKETYYPSVTDPAKATIIEVTEGSEATNIDIVMGRAFATFRVVGRVVDADSGKPVPNLRYGLGQKLIFGESSSSSSFVSISNDVTNANGEFRLENLVPGKYTIFITESERHGISAASATFDVVDRDVTDVLIKTTKGASLSGVVVFDGDPQAARSLRSLQICVMFDGKVGIFSHTPMSNVGQDGTFRIGGVQSGLAMLSLCSSDVNDKRFEIVRIERNGVLAERVAIKEREDVAGLRVFIKYVKTTGAIRGQLKVENGELPPLSQLSLMLWPLDENFQMLKAHSIPSPQLDARGRFFAERLPAGTYRISIWNGPPGRSPVEASQQVIVTDDTVTEVTLTIKP